MPTAKRCTCALAHNLTLLLLRQGKLEEAEELARESLAARARASMVEALDNAEEVNALLTKNQLARVLVDKGVFGEAEELFREAIAGLESLQGATNSNTLVCKNNLADVLMKEGRLDEAEPLLHAILDAGEVQTTPMPVPAHAHARTEGCAHATARNVHASFDALATRVAGGGYGAIRAVCAEQPRLGARTKGEARRGRASAAQGLQRSRRQPRLAPRRHAHRDQQSGERTPGPGQACDGRAALSPRARRAARDAR